MRGSIYIKDNINRHFHLFLVFLCMVLFLLSGISLAFGQADINIIDVYRIIGSHLFDTPISSKMKIAQSANNIIWFIRVPRVLLAIFVGIALSISGAVMQATVQNPLADPYILGVSSGATLGATFAIMVGFGTSSIFSQIGLTFSAFIGALIATILVLVLSTVGGKSTATKLILSGTIISALCSSISNFIIYFSNNKEGIKTITFWLMGSLAAAKWTDIPTVVSIVFTITIFMLTQSRPLNVLLLGDEAAMTLGISLGIYRQLFMILTALLTGVVVSHTGTIGFVGLIIPHIIRGFFGSDHKKLLPLSALLGAIFLVSTDLIARSIIENVELPIGIITSFIGAPIFIYILVKRGYNFGG